MLSPLIHSDIRSMRNRDGEAFHYLSVVSKRNYDSRGYFESNAAGDSVPPSQDFFPVILCLSSFAPCCQPLRFDKRIEGLACVWPGYRLDLGGWAGE